MKKIFLVLILFAIMVNCGGSSGVTPSPSSIDFYAKTEEVTPKVTPTTSTSISLLKAATWSSANNLYEIYQLIREYVDERDSGVIDGSNMHKAMFDAETYVDQALEGCTGTTNEDGSITPSEHLITEQSITPPFDFGDDLLQQTYDCAYTTNDSGTVNGEPIQYTKSFAVRQSGTVYYMLMGWHAYESESDTPSAMQVEYDTAANTIKVNNGYLVSYTTGDKYAVRIHVDGNITTHLFSLRLFKYSGGGNTLISIAGHGYSEGAGNYYLFRTTTTGTSETATDRYFCFESNTTEAQMQAMDDAGATTVPAECADLEANLPDNYNIDASEVPTSETSFTGGGDSHIELSWT